MHSGEHSETANGMMMVRQQSLKTTSAKNFRVSLCTKFYHFVRRVIIEIQAYCQKLSANFHSK